LLCSEPGDVDLDSCGAENFLVSDLSDALAVVVAVDVVGDVDKAFEGDRSVVVIVAGEPDAGMDTKFGGPGAVCCSLSALTEMSEAVVTGGR
jgi:hypothetical protein